MRSSHRGSHQLGSPTSAMVEAPATVRALPRRAVRRLAAEGAPLLLRIAGTGPERDRAMLVALERWDEQAAIRFEAFVTSRARENGARSAKSRA